MFSRYTAPASTIQSNNKQVSISLQAVAPEHRFSLPYLRKLHQILLDNEIVTDNNESLVVEILYTIAEMVVYGDNKSEMLFDFFCEKNMLSLFLRIMWAPQQLDTGVICSAKVHIQILQTLSILINSVKNNTSLYYLLSNNYINEMLIFPHNFEEDESLRDQFVSFMKTLSLRLNPQTIQFFFVEESGSFPLLSRAIDMLHFNEPMVRIASQTTILNIFKVCDNRARSYALQDEFMYKFLSEIVLIMENFFYTLVHLCMEYHALSIELDSVDLSNKSYYETISYKLNRIELSVNDQISVTEDWFYFIQDLLDLKINKLRRTTIYYILSEFNYPVLLAPILSFIDGNIDTSMYSMHMKEDNKSISKSFRRVSNDEFKEVYNIEMNQLEMNSSFDGLDGDHIDNNYGANKESENKESNDKLLILVAVSIYTLSQMFRIITDHMFHRALTVSIFHPLSNSGRRKALLNLITNQSNLDDSILSDEESSPATYDTNSYRHSVIKIIQLDNCRLAYLGALVYLYMTSGRINITTIDSESPSTLALLSQYINEWDYNNDDNLLSYNKNLKDTTNNISPLRDSHIDVFSPMTSQGFSIYTPDSHATKSFDYENVITPVNISNDINDSKDENSIDMKLVVKRVTTYDSVDSSSDQINNEKANGYINNELFDNDIKVNHNDSTILNENENDINKLINDIIDLIETSSDNIESATLQSVESDSKVNLMKERSKRFSLRYRVESDDLDKDVCNDIESTSSSINQEIDIISIHKLKCIHDITDNQNYQFIYKAYFSMLSENSSLHSITTYQIIIHTIYYQMLLINEYSKRGNKEIIANNFYQSILLDIRKAGCTVASSLLSSLSGPFADSIIDLFLEELRRIDNTSWSYYQNKILSDALILFPQNYEIIDRMNRETFIPQLKIDKLRLEIQLYIIIKSLYSQVQRLIDFPLQPFSIDDIGNKVSQDPFWLAFYDKCTVSHDVTADSIFKMKGKKYLDVYKCPLVAPTNIVTIPSEAYYDMSTSSMLSSLTFGFLGSSTASAAISLASNKRSSTSLSTQVSPVAPPLVTARPITSPTASNIIKDKPLYGQLLFVQDRSHLLLIRPEIPPASTHKPGEKIKGTFIVHISAPLIQTDVSIDPMNKNIMNIVVRSWHLPQPHMDIISGINNSSNNKIAFQNKIVTKSPTFLNPVTTSTLYQINIGFEFAQACGLAADHIQTRRKAIRLDKIKHLKKGFEIWLSMNSNI